MLVTGHLASGQIQPSQCCQQLLLGSTVQNVVFSSFLSYSLSTGPSIFLRHILTLSVHGTGLLLLLSLLEDLMHPMIEGSGATLSPWSILQRQFYADCLVLERLRGFLSVTVLDLWVHMDYCVP